MTENRIPINPTQFRNQATKAVLGYIRKQYSKFFSEEEMEEMISEVVLRMWRARDSYDSGKGTLSTWVGIIAKNVVRSAAEAKANRSSISGEFEDGEIQDNCTYSLYRSQDFAADRELLFEEMQERLFSKLKSDRYQRFLAWKIEGLDASEMAEREGITVEAVYMVLFHLKQRLLQAA